MLRSQVVMLADTLEQAIREVRLTVHWDGGGEGNEFVITTHLVRVPQASAAAGAGTQPGTGLPGGVGVPGHPGGPGTGSGKGRTQIQKTVQPK
jgi:hypothetical protein